MPGLANNSLQKIHGLSSQDIWLVGNPPTAMPTAKPPFLHYDGSSWSQIQQDVKVMGNLTAVYEVNPSFIVAVGGGSTTGSLIVWDGNNVTNYSSTFSTTRLYDVWGSDGNVFAVGAAGAIYRFDGSKWNLITTNIGLTKLNGITGVVTDAGTLIYVASDSGQIAYNTDSTFAKFAVVTGTPTYPLFSLHLASNGITWIGGQNGNVENGYIGYLDSRP